MHTFYYYCADPDGQMELRLAAWEILHLEPDLDEIRIHTENKTFDIILGFAYLASFVYIPDHNICFPVSDFHDTEHSRKQLSGTLSGEDAEAIAAALQCYVS